MDTSRSAPDAPVAFRKEAKPQIVLVDDNPMTVKLATYIFQEAGWKVHGFTSPEVALEALRSFEPDMIVTDFYMPQMNGIEFLLCVETLHPTTPKLVMTAHDDEEFVQVVLRRASVPSVNKNKGLTEVLSMATRLVQVRQAVKEKNLLMEAV